MIWARSKLWYTWGIVLLLFKKKYASAEVYQKVLNAQQEMEKQAASTLQKVPSLFLRVVAALPLLNFFLL